MGWNHRSTGRSCGAIEDLKFYHRRGGVDVLPKRAADGGNAGAGVGNGLYPPRELTPAEQEEARLKLWAFCRSPRGLGLSEDDFWCLSYREINAHRDVYDQNIQQQAIALASVQAEIRNANTRIDLQGQLYTADDFLHPQARVARIAQAKKDKMDEDFVNWNLAKIQGGKGKAPSKTVPFWALDNWDGSIPPEFAQPYMKRKN